MPYADPEARREASRRYYNQRYQSDPAFRDREAARKGELYDGVKHARWTKTLVRKLDRMIVELRAAGAAETQIQKLQAARDLIDMVGL